MLLEKLKERKKQPKRNSSGSPKSLSNFLQYNKTNISNFTTVNNKKQQRHYMDQGQFNFHKSNIIF